VFAFLFAKGTKNAKAIYNKLENKEKMELNKEIKLAKKEMEKRNKVFEFLSKL
jgi:hypothetical protein